MSVIVTVIHVIVCFVLIMAVLLQSGKAADLAGAFGGAGSQTVFGPRGAGTILGKITTISAIIFMFTSLGLWILSGKGDKSVVSGETAPPAAATDTQKAPEAAPTTSDAPAQAQQPSQAGQKPPASAPDKQ
ncbi:MAG: preprotein translocase subunit SecG [Candidatus Aminicenantes bacterium]|nr:preprotein translocase subunit SecG [Candidatus Aminicenantes bacterium]